MAVNSVFANGFGGAPIVGLLGSGPPDPAQSPPEGLLPNAPTPQPTVGVLGLPGDLRSVIDPPFDPYQLAGAGPQIGGDLALMAAQMRALRAIYDHPDITAGWLGQPAGQGGGPALDTTGGVAPSVQPPPPPVTASAARSVTAMAPPANALQPFDPSGGFTPDRTFTVGDDKADATIAGIAKQLYPDNPVAGLGLLYQANPLRLNENHSPVLITGRHLVAPPLPGDAASVSALEKRGQSVLSTNDQGLVDLAARRAAAARQQQQNARFVEDLGSGKNVWTHQPVEGSTPVQAWVTPWLNRLPTIPLGPLPASAPRTFGGHTWVDYPDSAGDHLYRVEGYRSDGLPVLSGGAFLVPPDPVGEAQAQRSARWGDATDAARENFLGAAGLLATHGAGASEDTQFKSAELGAGAGDLVLSIGAAGGETPGFANVTSPRFFPAPTDGFESPAGYGSLGGTGLSGVSGSTSDLADTISSDASRASGDLSEPTFPDGSFMVSDWSRYPEQLAPLRTGPFKLLEGDEYAESSRIANRARRSMHSADPSIKGLELHHIDPIKFGGDPNAPSNLIALPPAQHKELTAWWGQLQRDLEGRKK